MAWHSCSRRGPQVHSVAGTGHLSLVVVVVVVAKIVVAVALTVALTVPVAVVADALAVALAVAACSSIAYVVLSVCSASPAVGPGIWLVEGRQRLRAIRKVHRESGCMY